MPIPGTRRRTRLDKNAAAASVALSVDELAPIEQVLPAGLAAGLRYPEASMALVNG